MTKIETFQLVISGDLSIEAIDDIDKHLDYAKHEIEISEEILTLFEQLSEEAFIVIRHIVNELIERVRICKSFLIWKETLVYKKIQELYGVYQRAERSVNLNLDADLAYLRNIVKRDIRKNVRSSDYLRNAVLDVEPDVKMAYTGKFPDCIELYNPHTDNTLIWNPKTKSYGG